MADFSKRKGCAKNRGKALLRAPPDTYFRLDHFLTYRTLGGKSIVTANQNLLAAFSGLKWMSSWS